MGQKALIGTIWKGVEAMVLNDGRMTNEDAFWKCFEEISGLSRAEVEQETLHLQNRIRAQTRWLNC